MMTSILHTFCARAFAFCTHTLAALPCLAQRFLPLLLSFFSSFVIFCHVGDPTCCCDIFHSPAHVVARPTCTFFLTTPHHLPPPAPRRFSFSPFPVRRTTTARISHAHFARFPTSMVICARRRTALDVPVPARRRRTRSWCHGVPPHSWTTCRFLSAAVAAAAGARSHARAARAARLPFAQPMPPCRVMRCQCLSSCSEPEMSIFMSLSAGEFLIAALFNGIVRHKRWWCCAYHRPEIRRWRLPKYHRTFSLLMRATDGAWPHERHRHDRWWWL